MENQSFYEIREQDPNLQPVEVFMTGQESNGGQARYAGNIYTVPKYEADKYAANGSAEVVDVPTIKRQYAKIDALENQLQAAVDEIKNNKRLSNDGKREDIALLVRQYEAAADEIQEDYAREVATLKASEFEKSTKYAQSDTKLDSYEIRTQAGLVTAKASMLPSFEASVDAITERVTTMDSAVARELMAQFASIKSDLEGKRRGKDALGRHRESQAIKSLYDALEAAALSPTQKKARDKHRLLEAIEQQKSDVRTKFKQKTRAINFGLRDLR